MGMFADDREYDPSVWSRCKNSFLCAFAVPMQPAEIDVVKLQKLEDFFFLVPA